MATHGRVVYVCAHQDDITSVAGTMLLLRRKGYEVHDFCLTLGQKGGTAPNLAEIRMAEERAACAIIGAQVRFFDQMDGELFADRALCESVASGLTDLKPVAVFTMWPLEKPDHAAAFGVAHKALCMADLRWTTEFYMTQADTSGYVFYPDLYVNVSAVASEIRRVLQCYPSQGGPGDIEPWMQTKREYGRLAWCEYAEAFKTALPLVNERWNRRTEVGRVLLDL